jgi:hypothetical protein
VRRALGIVCLLGALAAAAGAGAAVPPPRLISVDPFAAGAQHETAVEPDNLAWGSTVVSVFQVGRFVGGGAAGVGWATSVDGGRTWRSGVLPGLTVHGASPGRYTAVSDPVIAYDRVHAVWLASALALLDAGGEDLESEVVTSRSPDGITWSAPVVTAANEGRFAHDKNWLVCDNGAASPFAGRCYTLWSDADRRSALGVSVSTDGGLTWSPPVTAGIQGTGWQPLARPDGVLVVPFLGPAGIQSVRSTDGGATFGQVSVVAELDGDDPPGVRAPPLPSAEIDGAGRVFVAWTDCLLDEACGTPGGPPNDVLVASTADGVRWSAPARVPTGASAGLHHFVPGLGVDATTSGAATRLAVAYYTLGPLGCNEQTCRVRPWLVGSRTAGRTWSAPEPLAAPTAFANLARSNRGRFVGDYISTAFAAGGLAVPVFSTAVAPFDGRFHQGVLAMAAPVPAAAPVVVPALGRPLASPVRPRAGARFAVTARVSGTASAPVTVACALRVGGAPVRPVVRRVAGGRARCEWRIPARAAGRRAVGSIAVAAAGRRDARSFAYVVAAAVRP